MLYRFCVFVCNIQKELDAMFVIPINLEILSGSIYTCPSMEKFLYQCTGLQYQPTLMKLGTYSLLGPHNGTDLDIVPIY